MTDGPKGWLRPHEHAASAWANGRGVTRELATGPGWRLSIADLTEDAPFSLLPGIDRVFVLVGGELTIHVDGTATRLTTGGAVAFPGEADVTVVVENAARAVNLMVQRDQFRLAVGDVEQVSEIRAADDEFIVLTTPTRDEGGELEAGAVWRGQTVSVEHPASVRRLRLRQK